MEKRRSESTVFPKPLEQSGDTVYVRSNVTAEERTSNGTTVAMYVYDEEQYNSAEYQTKVVEKTRADVDYIAIMQGVDLDV